MFFRVVIVRFNLSMFIWLTIPLDAKKCAPGKWLRITDCRMKTTISANFFNMCLRTGVTCKLALLSAIYEICAHSPKHLLLATQSIVVDEGSDQTSDLEVIKLHSQTQNKAQ